MSGFWSPYHKWFVELGHPTLDIMRWDDGEWAILQTFNYPVIPCLCKWNFVLKFIRNVEVTRSFAAKYTELLDVTKAAFWEREDNISKETEDEDKRREVFRKEIVQKMSDVIKRNPVLYERVAKNGIQEILPHNIAKHISPTVFKHNFGG